MKAIKIATICLAILFTHCKKEETTPVVSLSDCITFPEVKNSGLLNFKGYQIISSDTSYSRPTFSPYNPNEIIYYREIFWHNEEWTQMGKEKSLTKYNLATGEKTLLLQGEETSPDFAWSVKGQVIYPAFKAFGSMKDDGTNKTTLFSTDVAYASFSVNGDGTKFIAATSQYPTQTIIMDIEAKTIDTFMYYWDGQGLVFTNGDWSASDSIVTYFLDDLHFGLATWGLADSTMNPILKYPRNSNGLVGRPCWHPDNQTIFFSTREGIQKVKEGNFTLLKENCDSKGYGQPSVSPDGKKLLYTRRNYIKLDERTLRSESRIYIMNIDGSGEKQLVLD